MVTIRFNALSEPLFILMCHRPPSLTQLLQGGDPELVIVVVGQWRRAFPHDFRRDGLGRHLHRLHTTDEGLEPLVGERGLTPVQLYDPAGEDGALKTCRTQVMGSPSGRCSSGRVPTYLSRS